MAVRAKRVIYWFSGTGNSYRAAERIAQALGDTELVSMRCNPAEVSAEDAEMIGFVFPVYHWTLNESAQKFIEGLRINPRAYVFAVSTLALINGYAFEALDAILRRKGTRLQYARRLFSVANLCIVYPPFPSPRWRVPATERKLRRIAADVRRQATNRYAKAGWLTRVIYPRMMPKYRDGVSCTDFGFTVSGACVGCGLCASVCPQRNIRLENSKPVFSHRCACCMACVCYCPSRAIGFRQPPEWRTTRNTLFIRMMKLPERRLRYHHPAVKAAELACDRRLIE